MSASCAEELLLEAAATVNDRRTAYGEPAEHFERVAMRWSQVLGVPVTPAQVVLCLLDLKLARLVHDPAHEDSQRDVAGYAGCLREVTR
jgi:hypothetical protein